MVRTIQVKEYVIDCRGSLEIAKLQTLCRQTHDAIIKYLFLFNTNKQWWSLYIFKPVFFQFPDKILHRMSWAAVILFHNKIRFWISICKT